MKLVDRLSYDFLKGCIAGIVVAVIIAAALFIGVGTYEEYHAPANLTETTYQLTDTRRVPCIILDYDTYAQAMSCDWAHADGGDNL